MTLPDPTNALARSRAEALQDLMIRAEQCRLRDRFPSQQHLAAEIDKLGDQIQLQRILDHAALYRRLIDVTNEAAEAAKRHAEETLKVRDALRELANFSHRPPTL